jgi:hypothetical protein
LNFPIAAGIRESQDYRAATRRGILPPPDRSIAPGIPLVDPDGLRLFLHPTAAGRIPVIVAPARDDFVTLVRALTRRNEPDPIPASMGACVVAGYSNWDRVRALRRQWEETQTETDRSDAAWWRAFASLVPRKELYQDRFILLSSGPYSSVAAEEVGMARADWLATSLTLRLEHECAHYFTRRVFGSMHNSLLDELIADYIGIVAAAGRFQAEWLLRFMGVEDPLRYRAGSRLENYRGQPPLSHESFLILQSVVRRAAENLAAVDLRFPTGSRKFADRARAIVVIASFGLERLAAADGVEMAWKELEQENERERVGRVLVHASRESA